MKRTRDCVIKQLNFFNKQIRKKKMNKKEEDLKNIFDRKKKINEHFWKI